MERGHLPSTATSLQPLHPTLTFLSLPFSCPASAQHPTTQCMAMRPAHGPPWPTVHPAASERLVARAGRVSLPPSCPRPLQRTAAALPTVPCDIALQRKVRAIYARTACRNCHLGRVVLKFHVFLIAACSNTHLLHSTGRLALLPTCSVRAPMWWPICL